KVYYSVLDLKDAFFTLPLAAKSQPIFAFEWTDPEGGFSGQLTWTRLPQGFKNSPTIFDEALSRDLLNFRDSHPQLDPVAAGWPSCMRAIAATALLVKEAQKLTLGQDLQIIGGHTTEALLRSPPDRWISNARLTQYQELPSSPSYNEEELHLGRKLNCSTEKGNWHRLPDGRLLLPKALGIALIRDLHYSTHLGTSKLISLVSRHFYIPDLKTIATSEVTRCSACAQVNPGPPRPHGLGV
ncbi:uncharacterized protein WM277_010884, partial [Molossus nigricans]